MKQIRTFAPTLATSCCIIYLLLQWKEINTLFTPAFIVLMKQVLVISLFATIAVNPTGVISAAARIAPKILEVMAMFANIFTPKKKDDGNIE